MGFNILLNNLISLFGLIIVGWLAGVTKTVNRSSTKDISNFLIKITLPCSVFASLIRPFDFGLLKDCVIMFIVSFVIYSFALALNYGITLLLKIPKKEQGVWIMAGTFSNTGFMGFPIILAIFGAEALFLATISNIVFNLFIFSAGIKIMTIGYERDNKISIKRIFISNVNIAIVLGLSFFISQIPINSAVFRCIEYFGSITTPLSMFLVGLSISKNKFSDLFTDKQIYVLSAVRLIIMPLFVLVILKLLNFQNPLIGSTLVVTTAMPAASSLTMIGEQFDANVSLAARVLFITSLMSVITIPFILFLL